MDQPYIQETRKDRRNKEEALRFKDRYGDVDMSEGQLTGPRGDERKVGSTTAKGRKEGRGDPPLGAVDQRKLENKLEELELL